MKIDTWLQSQREPERLTAVQARRSASPQAISDVAEWYAAILSDPQRAAEIRVVRERYLAEQARRAEAEETESATAEREHTTRGEADTD